LQCGENWLNNIRYCELVKRSEFNIMIIKINASLLLNW
jgi:hypothetical protein